MGPHLGNNLINLGLFDKVKEAIGEFGLDLDDILEQEEEPGLPVPRDAEVRRGQPAQVGRRT